MYTLIVAVCLVVPLPTGTRYQCRAERLERLSNTVCTDLKNMALARQTENIAVDADCIETGVVGVSPEVKS
jgi:hypothetical protein